MASPLVECNNLLYAYGEKNVLENLSFSLHRGSIFGLLGKNGAGKSTTINILMGYLKPLEGTCTVLGEPSHRLSCETRRKIGLLHEGFIQYDFMSIEQLEQYSSSFYPKWDRAIFFDLADRLQVPYTRRLSQLSCGQRSQVVLGLIMAQKPELMILDDYSMGLDVGYRRLFLDFLKFYVRKHNTTVLLTSHVVQELDRLIDELIVLKKGQVCMTGTRENFMEHFKCFEFDQSASSLRLQPDKQLSLVEQIDDASTRVYTFMDQQGIAEYLRSLGIESHNLRRITMNFEDAFVGLTGKY